MSTLPRKVRSSKGTTGFGTTDDPILVADFDELEELASSGVSSERLAVVVDGDRSRSLESARAGLANGLGPVPPRPHSFGRRLLVVVPTYNERETIEPILDAIETYLQADILVVDDSSPDGTGDLVDQRAAHDDQLRVMHRPGKGGLATAYLDGFRYAIEHGYDGVFEMDADFSHPPWDLPRLAAAGATTDLVIGSRYVPGGGVSGWNAKRRWLSRGANFYARAVLGHRVRDMTAGYRCYAVNRLAQLDLDAIQSRGYAFQVEFVDLWQRNGFSIRELPILFVDRRAGESKMGLSIAIEAIGRIPAMRFRRRKPTKAPTARP